MKKVVSFIRKIFKEEGYLSVNQANSGVSIIIGTLSLLLVILTAPAFPEKSGSPLVLSLVFTIYALIFLLLYFLDPIWEPFWQTILNSNLEIARRTNNIKKFEITTGYRKDYGRFIIEVEWETDVDSFAELLVWRSPGTSHLHGTEEDVRAQADAKQIGIARNGEPLTCKDADVQNNQTFNYYAWIHLPEKKTKNSSTEGAFPQILDAIDFKAKQKIFRSGEREEDYLERQIRIGELKTKAEPPKLPEPVKDYSIETVALAEFTKVVDDVESPKAFMKFSENYIESNNYGDNEELVERLYAKFTEVYENFHREKK